MYIYIYEIEIEGEEPGEYYILIQSNRPPALICFSTLER